MDKQQLFEQMQKAGAAPEYGRKPITSNLIWGVIDGTPVVAVGGDLDYETRVHALIDAAYWSKRRGHDKGTLRLVYGSGPRDAEVLETVATLMGCYQGPLRIQVEQDFQPVKMRKPDFTDIGGKWVGDVEKRSKAKLPALARDLKKLVAEPSFRWYRTVTGKYWSGRVEGLEVCRIEDGANKGRLDIGKPGKTGNLSHERKVFMSVAKGVKRDFETSDLPVIADVIRKLVQERDHGRLIKDKDEHRLEAQVLRGKVKVMGGQAVLKPVCGDPPFQFPTKWSEKGQPRYVDVLMHEGNVPYVVELKVGTASIGQYYRHAITQAALYREYIKGARLFHPWFKSQGLDATYCRAVVAFPVDKRDYPEDLDMLAGWFDVEIVQLKI